MNAAGFARKEERDATALPSSFGWRGERALRFTGTLTCQVFFRGVTFRMRNRGRVSGLQAALSGSNPKAPGFAGGYLLSRSASARRSPIFALPHNRIDPYSDDALAALVEPQLDCGRRRKATDAPTPTVPEGKCERVRSTLSGPSRSPVWEKSAQLTCCVSLNLKDDLRSVVWALTAGSRQTYEQRFLLLP